MFCEKCGYPTEVGASFCGNCGAKLTILNQSENPYYTTPTHEKTANTNGIWTPPKFPETNYYHQLEMTSKMVMIKKPVKDRWPIAVYILSGIYFVLAIFSTFVSTITPTALLKNTPLNMDSIISLSYIALLIIIYSISIISSSKIKPKRSIVLLYYIFVLYILDLISYYYFIKSLITFQKNLSAGSDKAESVITIGTISTLLAMVCLIVFILYYQYIVCSKNGIKHYSLATILTVMIGLTVMQTILGGISILGLNAFLLVRTFITIPIYIAYICMAVSLKRKQMILASCELS